MKRFPFALVAVLAIALAGDATWAQRGGAPPGGGARPPPGGAPGSGWHGAPRPGGWHGSGYRGWYGPRVGVYFGAPFYWGGWGPYGYGYGYGYGYPYAYPYPYPYPYPAYAPATPPVYVEQGDQPAPTGYWFYCEAPAGYYPYVRECTKAWITVEPQSVPVNPPPPAPPQ